MIDKKYFSGPLYSAQIPQCRHSPAGRREQ